MLNIRDERATLNRAPLFCTVEVTVKDRYVTIEGWLLVNGTKPDDSFTIQPSNEYNPNAVDLTFLIRELVSIYPSSPPEKDSIQIRSGGKLIDEIEVD